MPHVHSLHARARRLQKAISKGFVFRHNHRQAINKEKDPWEVEDPWSIALQNRSESVTDQLKGCEVANDDACVWPPCPPPLLPPGLDPDAQPFFPAAPNHVPHEAVHELLKSALQLIESQNATIAHLMQVWSQASKQPASDDDAPATAGPHQCCSQYLRNATPEILQQAKETLEVELQRKTAVMQQAFRETLDAKDHEIAALRDACNGNRVTLQSVELATAQASVEEPCGEKKLLQEDVISQPRVVEKPEMKSDDENWEYIENIGEIIPVTWNAVFKRNQPVTVRCSQCMQSLDPSLGAWQCMKCHRYIHAYEDWTCKADHRRCGCQQWSTSHLCQQSALPRVERRSQNRAIGFVQATSLE